jgi:DNA-binding response OmpR family regulator
MSGYPANLFAQDGVLDEPFVDLLEKPFTSADLLARVEAALGRAAAGR